MQNSSREPDVGSREAKTKGFVFRLKSLRRLLGLSQAELAERAGIPVWLERKLENLRTLPKSVEVVARLASALGTSIWDVFATRISHRLRSGSRPAVPGGKSVGPLVISACYRSPYLMIASMHDETANAVQSKRISDKQQIPLVLRQVALDHHCKTVVVEPDVQELCESCDMASDVYVLSLGLAKSVLFPEVAKVTHDDLVRFVGPSCTFLKERAGTIAKARKPSVTQPWVTLQILPVAIGLAHQKLEAAAEDLRQNY